MEEQRDYENQSPALVAGFRAAQAVLERPPGPTRNGSAVAVAKPPVSGQKIHGQETLDNVVAWFHRGSGCGATDFPREPEGNLQRGCSVAVCTYKRAKSLARLLDSLLAQDRKPDRLVIVDASPDDETEQAVRNHPSAEQLADCLLYFRVGGPLKGLTRQRNFALRWIATDLVVFFDDDIVLLPGCLREMEKAHRAPGEHIGGEHVVGVGAFIEGQTQCPGWLWRARHLLRAVPDLQPGRYHRSGISTSWRFLSSTEEVIEGDWIAGNAMMWKTAAAREVGFHEGFGGYAQGEDLEFSLRMRHKGKIVLAGAARLRHLHEPGGRPNHYQLGYMMIYNKYHIHRRAFPERARRDVAWFSYAWTIDTLLLARHFVFPGRCAAAFQEIAGRLKAACDIARGH
jgi:GT2 family glycosyltransferase